MTADEDIELGPFRPRDYMQGKTIVHHHHGHPDFRGNKDLKNTTEFIHAVDKLKRESKTLIELRLIENTSHKECLRLKRESHILFDHLQGYYGVSSLEGLSQGLCVVAGLDEWNKKHIKIL